MEKYAARSTEDANDNVRTYLYTVYSAVGKVFPANCNADVFDSNGKCISFSILSCWEVHANDFYR